MMFPYGIACALEDLPERDPVNLRGTIEDLAEKAKKAGYDAIELQMKNPGQYDGKHMKAVADSLGLAFCAIATGMEYSDNGLSLISADRSVRQRAVDRLKEHMELAKVLDCAVIVGRMRSSIPDWSQYQRYEDYFTEALLELSDYGQRDNQLLVVEPVMRYICNYFNNLPETSDYLKRLGRDNIMLHMDTHSMIIEDANLPEAIRHCADTMGYVHFSDSNRRYPGGGNIDFQSIMEALDEIGYIGYVTFECVPWPSQMESAVRGIDYIRALEKCIWTQRQSKLEIK